jgi:hypothetical protein
MRTRNVAVVFAGLLVSCGGTGDALVPKAGDLAANLRVTVAPEGPGGPERIRRIQCAVLGEDAIDRRCRVLGGGPGTARITGELRGMRVWAAFDLTNACEIARWRSNAALLGAPGIGHVVP